MFTDFNTKISKKNIKKIRNKRLSARDIVDYLNTGATFHSFEYILGKVYPSDDIRKDVEEALNKTTEGSAESISRNVRNWLNGRVLPSREDVFLLSFALHLKPENVNDLLGASSDTGIHFRNPRELIYYYGLKNELDWQKISKIRDRLLPLCEERMQNVMNDTAYQEMISRKTRQIEKEFDRKVQSEEDLELFLMQYTPYLGYLHLTAYQDFLSILQLLQRTDLNDEKMSITKVVENYLTFGMKQKPNGKQMDYLEKAILKNWPSSNTIYKMQTHRQDVSRKIMILLFLVTEEFMIGENLWSNRQSGNETKSPRYENILQKDYRWNADDILEVRITHMNMYLEKYGMNLLNPGTPFDCMVLYALKASYDDRKCMSDRFQELLKKLFDIEK